jgi:hypothetical protein
VQTIPCSRGSRVRRTVDYGASSSRSREPLVRDREPSGPDAVDDTCTILAPLCVTAGGVDREFAHRYIAILRFVLW